MLPLVIAVLVSAGPKAVAPFCNLSAFDLTFHVEIASARRGEDGGTLSSASAYHVRCDLKRRECRGASVRLGRDTLDLFDITALTIELRSVVGEVAVLAWGLHQFVFDSAAGTVTLTAPARGGGVERGVGRCPQAQ